MEYTEDESIGYGEIDNLSRSMSITNIVFSNSIFLRKFIYEEVVNMSNHAMFYKCALQVNPHSYNQYRGKEHKISEAEYNQQILESCTSENIKVIGLADHGNINSSESLRKLLTDNDITVFPGFEIASSEKIHMVCLFPENTSATSLNRYLGKLDITDPNDGVSPSKYSCLEIAKIVEDDLEGFWYAAHVTGDNGVLKIGKMNHIWKDSRLKAAQIPDTLENVPPNYKTIINNKEPTYKREYPLGYINAKDISEPSELLEKNSYCLIKMSDLNFDSFKDAFHDPVSRVKLSHDQNEVYHSSIDSISIYGGYLDGFTVDLSRHLNTTIGGRGTGKSTLLELIRYALELEPKSITSKKIISELVRYNLGQDKGRIELNVTSHSDYGNKYKIIKRYDDTAVVETIDGHVSNLKVNDILPNIEIFGQNEIIELINNDKAKLNILDRFLPKKNINIYEKKDVKNQLKKNSMKLIEACNSKEEKLEIISKLPALEEKDTFFKKEGISDKLSKLEALSTEEEYLKKADEVLKNHTIDFKEISLPFSSEIIDKTLNPDKLKAVDKIFNHFNESIRDLKEQYTTLNEKFYLEFNLIFDGWKLIEKESDKEIRESITSLEGLNGKTGSEIASDYRSTIQEIARIKPIEVEVEKIQKDIDELSRERNTLLEKLRKIQDDYYDSLRKSVRKLNKGKLKGKVEIVIHPSQNREELLTRLAEIDGLGERSLLGIKEIENLTISSFLDDINEGHEKLMKKYKLSPSKAEILSNISFEKKLEIELIELIDVIDVKLNIASIESTEENYKSLNMLSKGQQCTAILSILMLDNNDPLIIDQPEDNLDNSYIANNFIDGLRDYKLNRQFIFSTHNANIPVFGDAELILVMNEENGQGSIKEGCIGAVDNYNVKESVIRTLEGGDTAFKMRRAKYNL